jgi:hypothetical protein
MRKAAILWLTISPLLASSTFLAGHNSSSTASMQLPPILNIFRESVKPGNLDAYTAIEREAVHTCVRLHCPNSYFALQAGLEARQIWFISLFDSQEAADRAAAIYAQNAELHAAMAQIAESKKDMVSSPENTLVKYREDLSRDLGTDVPHALVMTINIIHVRDGHIADFEKRQKLINRAAGNRDSGSAEAHPVGLVYQGIAAADALTFFIILPRRHQPDNLRAPQVRDAALEAEIDRLGDAAVASSETIWFGFRPDFSCLPPEWIAADPNVWAPAGIYVSLHAR